MNNEREVQSADATAAARAADDGVAPPKSAADNEPDRSNPARAFRWIAWQFQHLLPELARRARELDDEHARRAKQIESEYRQRRESIDTTLKDTVEKADRQRRDVERRTSAQCDAAIERADRMAEQLRAESDEKAQSNRQAAEKAQQESIWMAEAMFEANEVQPKEQYEQIRTAVEAQMDALDAVEADAVARIRRFRQKPQPNVAQPQPIDPDAAVEPLKRKLADVVESANAHLRRLNRLVPPKLFVDVWPFLFILILAFVGGGLAFLLMNAPLLQQMLIGIGGGVGAALLVLVVSYVIARRQCHRAHERVQQCIATGRALRDAVLERAAENREATLRRLLRQRDSEIREATQKIRPVIDEINRRHDAHRQRIADKYEAELKKIETHRDTSLAEARQQHEAITSAAKSGHDDAVAELDRWREQAESGIEGDYRSAREQLLARWKSATDEAYVQLETVQTIAEREAPPWAPEAWAQWSPPLDRTASICIGSFAVDAATLLDRRPEALTLPGPDRFELPALLYVPGDCSLLIETRQANHRSRGIRMLQSAIARLLTTLPPGKVRFVIIDPVALGQNFAGFMHLADYEGALVGQRIWTEQAHIQQRLVDLTEHMENVIQKYLRNEFESIAQYNDAAGEIAEPYRFLVIADFPTNFTDESVRRLMSIVNSGARCGVHTIIHLDHRCEMPRGLDLDELRSASVNIACSEDECAWNDPLLRDLPFAADDPPDEDLLTKLMHDIGREAVESTRVQVPFQSIVPDEDERWTRSASTQVRVPLGRSGASKIQELSLGRDTAQHALIAGKTGSGKSTLLHVLITSLALWYRPDEIELYLVDFKKGVEFKTYVTHDLPHAKVIAIESDREFGLSVLQKLDVEMRRRGDLFREHGVQDVAGFRAHQQAGPLPRILLVIDEFQEFFTEDDRIAQEAALLLDRLVRQGRAFGMHVLLGSQTLGGAYSLARSTIGQMNVRIALQCSESDSYLIMNEDNAAARLLSRPGEAIYNDAAGLVEGNSPFQVVWLPAQERERALKQVRQLAESDGFTRDQPQVVFEGNTPGRLEANAQLQRLIDRDDWPEHVTAPLIWLGDAVAIKDPTAATIARRGGANLLIVGQQSETADSLVTAAMISLAAQLSPTDARFVLLDSASDAAAREPGARAIAEALPHDAQAIRPREAGDALADVVAVVRSRHDGGSPSPAVVLLIDGLHRFRALRHVDDFSFSMDEDKPPSPDKLLAEILRDGPEVGVHVIAWCDSANNLNRMMERATQREFEMRVLMQMSAADSTALIDSPEASRIGLQRAVYASEDAGVFEKFRPYGTPAQTWLDEVIKRLNART